MRRLFFAALYLLPLSFITAQTVFRSAGNGNWTNPASWEARVNGSWIAAPVVPSVSADTIIIQPGHEITITDQRQHHGLLVKGLLTIGRLGVLDVGTLLNALEVVDGGIVQNQGLVSGGPYAIRFGSGSRYRHLYDDREGSIPLATWEAGSVVEIAGYTTWLQATTSGNWGQQFGHLEWNTPALNGDFILNGLLQSVGGDLRIIHTGGKTLRLTWQENLSLYVGRDLDVQEGRLSVSKSGPVNSSVNVVIGRDFLFRSPDPLGSRLCEQGVSAFTVRRNFRMDAGLLYFSSGSGGSSNSGGDLRVAGDFFLNNGTLDASVAYSNRVGDLFFSGNTEQLFFNRGSILGAFNYRLVKGSTVRIPDGHWMPGNNLEVGDATGGATLMVMSTDPDGAIQKTQTATGNVRVRTQTWRAGSTVIYGGDQPQFIGSDHPSGAGITCVVLNPAGVSVSASGTTAVCGGDLIISVGELKVSANNLTVRKDLRTVGGSVRLSAIGLTSTRTLTMDGTMVLSGPDLLVESDPLNNAGNALLALGGDVQGTGTIGFIGPNCQVQISGASRTISRPFPVASTFSLESLTINAPVNLIVDKPLTLGNYTSATASWTGGIFLNGGNLNMKAPLKVTTVASLVSGVLDFSGQVLELQRNIQTAWPTGVFVADSLSEMRITSAFAGTDNTIAFLPGRNRLGKLLLDRSADFQAVGGLPITPHVRLNSPLVITGELELRDGEFFNASGLEMKPGSRIIRTTAAGFSSATLLPPAGGSYHVLYRDGIKSGSIISGMEAQGAVGILEVAVSGKVEIPGTVIQAGQLKVTSGLADCTGNELTVDSVSVRGTLRAPANLRVGGVFRNEGQFSHSNGTLTFAGDGYLKGGVATILGNVEITGRLTLDQDCQVEQSWVNDGELVPSGHRVTFGGFGGQVIGGTKGTEFHHLRIENATDTVRLEKVAGVSGVLYIGPRSVFDAADQKVVLRSTASDRTGRIGALEPTAMLLGRIELERYMDARQRYRYFSQPFRGVRFQDIADRFPMWVGYQFRYDETVAGYKDWGWVRMSMADTLHPGTGYISWPSPSVYWKPLTWSTSGELETGVNRDAVDLKVLHTASPDPKFSNDGWNLVGNPYPSAIQWSIDPAKWSDGKGGSARNIYPVVYLRDSGTGGVRSYNALTGVGDIAGGTGILSSGQAFWVHTTGPDPRLVLHEAAKVPEGGIYNRRAVVHPPALKLSAVTATGFAAAFLLSMPGTGEGFDYGKDALQVPDTLLSVSFVGVDGQAYVHQAMEKPEHPIALEFRGITTPVFGATASFINGFDRQELLIRDRKTGVRYPLNGDTVKLESAGAGSGRYELVFDVLEDDEAGTPCVGIYPNPVSDHFMVSGLKDGLYSVRILDITGLELSRIQLEVAGEEPEVKINLKSASYLVEISGPGKRSVVRLAVAR